MTRDFKIDFIGIGAAKCATSWVYVCLLEHPQICGSIKKELNFFKTERHSLVADDLDHRRFLHKRGIGFYRKYYKNCRKDKIKGEFSVVYMTDKGSPELIKNYFPEVKIIAILRNPVERAYSLFWYAKDFMLTEKNENFEKALERNSKPYIEDGMYYKQLERYLKLFPSNNIGVFIIDDLKDNPIKFIQNIYKFLGVDDNFIPPSIYKKNNEAKIVRIKFLRRIFNGISYLSKFLRKIKLYFIVDGLRELRFDELILHIKNNFNVKKIDKPEIKEETQKKLKLIFKEDVEKLEKLLNRSLNSWK